jgi:drug/metabolite transporter (DMT)-like permease
MPPLNGPALGGTWFAGLEAPVRAALLMVGACAGFSAMMAIVRLISTEIHPFEAAFFRNVFGLLYMLPWVLRTRGRRLRTHRPVMHISRAVLGMIAMLLLFTAVSLMPLADVTALSFTAPLFATIGAALILRETVGVRRWTATLIGLAGALIIIRPGADTFTPAALIALASAAGIAAAQLSVKSLSRTEHPSAIVVIMGLLMTPMTLVPALFVWTWPSAEALAWMALMGLVATIGQVMLVRAMATADASAVMPFDFSRLVFAALLGWLVFGELPDGWTLVGGAVIVTATVYIARRDALLSRRTRRIVPPPT